MRLRTIIADDEPLARERVRSFLKEEADIEIVAECGSGDETVRAIEEHRPDLLFLDIQMPALDGFEVLQALAPEQVPAVIFTTAHDEYAIRAFEVNALDYLLKPWSEIRFRKALERARQQCINLGASRPDANLSALLAHVGSKGSKGGRILVKSPDRIVFLKPEEIDHIEAAGNYVLLHVAKERHILRETMAVMEARLAGCGFMRINRSAIVNLSRVREVQPIATGQYSVQLKNGTRLDMTCTLRELQARLSEV